MTVISMMKVYFFLLSFFYVIFFNFTAIIPYPSAWFPLNGTYGTSEIENRTTTGFKVDEVYLSLGPDGTQDGSYYFRGSRKHLITFSGDNLAIGVSITILCWLYTYDNNAETIFLQYKNTMLSVHGKTLTLKSSKLKGLSLTGPLAEKGWTFVGVSYNETSAEPQLRIDGNVVNSEGLSADFISHGSQFLKLGGTNFKGKITQLMLFNLTLTQDQIRGIKGAMKLPGETERYIFTIKMNSFRYFKTYVSLKKRCRHVLQRLSLYHIR